MPVNYPKFDKKIQEQIESHFLQQSKTRSGLIASYNSYKNTATIILDSPNTGEISSILVDVPVPISEGIQTVAPLLGTRCMVMFRGRNESEPYIVNMYQPVPSESKKSSRMRVKTGIPRFMVTK